MTCLGPRTPTARVVHPCDYCAEPIPAGQRYRRWCYVEGGTASTVRAHIACDDVAQDYYDAGDCYDEERWVDRDALTEWPYGLDDPRDALVLLAAAGKWPWGEEARLARIMGLERKEMAP